MAFTNFETKEINCKVLYFGPSSAGKTASLRSIYSQTSPDVRSGMLELSEQTGPTQFFDFLPVSLGNIKDFHLKIHLYALPSHTLYPTLPSVILKGIDGYVFVADSRADAMGENIVSLLAAKRLLSEEGYNVSDLPRVIQYNKRDLPNTVSLEILRQELNPGGAPDQESIATSSVGTMEALQAMAKQVLRRLAPTQG